MIRPRFLFAFVAVASLAGGLVAASNLEAAIPSRPVATAPITTTSAGPDFAALVDSGASNALQDEELQLTAMATARATSTMTAPPATTSPADAVAAGYVSSAEGDFASQINSFRGSSGLPSLSRDGSLDAYARKWAEKLAEDGSLSHSNLSSLFPPWSAAGENVGVGGSVAGIFDALVDSPGHRDTMLSDFTHFGVGVYQDSSGAVWTAHVFTR